MMGTRRKATEATSLLFCLPIILRVFQVSHKRQLDDWGRVSFPYISWRNSGLKTAIAQTFHIINRETFIVMV